MEFRQLEYFIAVCRQKSFTRASEVLFVSQPAITNAVNNLENELGIKLFNRTKRSVELTAEGQTFYRHVSAVLNDVDHILLQMNQLKEQKRQVLKAAVDSVLALPIFLPVYRQFQESYPQIRLSCFYCGGSEIQAGLEREGYQIGVVLGDPDSFHSDRIKAEKVLSGKLCAVGCGEKQEPEQIILMSPGYLFAKKAAAYFKNKGEKAALSYSSNLSVTAELLKGERCAALVPDFLLPFFGECRPAALEIPDLEADIYLLAGSELTDHGRIFYHDLEEFITGRQFL